MNHLLKDIMEHTIAMREVKNKPKCFIPHSSLSVIRANRDDRDQ